MKFEKEVPSSLSESKQETYAHYLWIIKGSEPKVLQNFDGLKEVQWMVNDEIVCTTMYMEDSTKMVSVEEPNKKKEFYLREENQINEFFDLWRDLIIHVADSVVAAEPVS